MLFHPGWSEDGPHEANFMQILGKCEGMRPMKTWGRRVHLGEGTGSAKALRLDWSVLCLLWEKQQEELDGQAEMGEGRRSRD